MTYQFFGDEVVAFVQQATSLRLVRDLSTREALERLLRRLDAQWRRFADPSLAARQQSHILAATQDVLQQLHLALIAPLDIIDEPGVIFVPIGTIANVPFAALHDGTCYLIERMPVVMSPSRQAAEFAAGVARHDRRRLVMGIFDEHTPHIFREANAIEALEPTATVLLDEAATTAGLWEHLPEHDVVHIASHGIERPDNPLFGALRFSDRWLTAAEITGATLDGQLVVLSACSSGNQFGSGGEDELNGLPRAFLAAGAGAVVVNLWQVEDRSAADLMTDFHHRLQSASVPEAMRAAQIKAMQERPHPYWWASSAVIGALTLGQETT